MATLKQYTINANDGDLVECFVQTDKYIGTYFGKKVNPCDWRICPKESLNRDSYQNVKSADLNGCFRARNASFAAGNE